MKRAQLRTCRCLEHPDGGPVTYREHTYRLEEDENRLGLRWRAQCSCERFRGHWQYQSDSVAYHSWLRHVAHVLGWKGQR